MGLAPRNLEEEADLARATRAARALGSVYSAPPVPVEEIANRQGVRVIPATFGKLQEDVSGVCDFKARAIHVNAEDPPERRHYAIAHELAHFVLHEKRLRSDPESYRLLPRFGTPEADSLEREAHRFASELLVPEGLLRQVASKGPPAMLARIFKVPIDLMERRLKSGD
jgi:Zn-dependent peptidase ImmA (M78 family)